MLTIGLSGEFSAQVTENFADNNFGFDGEQSCGQHGPYKYAILTDDPFRYSSSASRYTLSSPSLATIPS